MKNFKSIAVMAWRGEPLDVYTLCYSAACRLSSTCFGRLIPSPVVNIPTKNCDGRG